MDKLNGPGSMGTPRRSSQTTRGEIAFGACPVLFHQVIECPEREMRCPSCGDTLPARLMAEHTPLLCRSTTWKCGCGEGPFPLVDRPGHLRTCDAFIDAWEASIEKVGSVGGGSLCGLWAFTGSA